MEVFPPLVVGALKPSITSHSLGSLQLTPACSQLTPQFAPQFTPACSPVCSSLLPPYPIAPYTPQVVGTPTHTWPLGESWELGASWEWAGASWSKLGANWSELEQAGSWEQAESELEWAGSELGASWSELGMSWSKLEQGGSKGSEVGVRGASFSLLPCCPLAPCPLPQWWWRPQYIVSCSLDIGSEVQLAGSEGSDSRDLGVRGVIWEWGEPASACSHLAP